ncbi:MAG: MlaD family protein [Deltaproteobacteria bacterium]|jgi:ABC-type transporter Mla subunit MlaD
MSRRISRFKLGLFVLVCAGIGVGALIWIGVAHFFEPTKTYVTFFNVSVAGLQRGAPVDYLGVRIGRISSIDLAPDGRLVRVLMELRPDFRVSESMAADLAQEGITGQRYVAIGKAPANIKAVTPKIDFPVKYPVIPSRPGEMTEISNALETLYKKVESVDLEGLLSEWKKTAVRVNAILSEKDLPETLGNLKEISFDLKTLLEPLGERGAPDEWKKSFKSLASTIAAAQSSAESLEAQLAAIPPNTFADISKRADEFVQTGESSIRSLDSQLKQSLDLFQESVYRLNQLLADFRGLVQSLKEEPGRILTRPEGSEPFRRQP